MAASLTVKPTRAQTGGGGRSPIDYRNRGGGGGERDGGGRNHNDAPDYRERLRRYRLGLAVASAAIVLLFISVSAAFVLRQDAYSWNPALGAYVTDTRPVPLPFTLLAINSVVLALSSLTIELARRQAARRAVLAPVLAIPGISAGSERAVPWLALSGALGSLFLAGQGWAWHRLVERGFDIAAAPNSSFFYVLTATHAAHILGGLIAVTYAGVAVLIHRNPDRHRVVVDVVAWYWHVMAVIWMFVFAVLCLAA